jgi:holin-like protein
MVAALLALLVCQVAGELMARVLHLPVPGPVIGTVLLLLVLLVRGRVPDMLRDVARGLLTHLSLLFVPAGVGIIQHFGRIREEWLGIAAAVFGSTVLTIVVAAIVFRVVSRLTGADGAETGREQA